MFSLLSTCKDGWWIWTLISWCPLFCLRMCACVLHCYRSLRLTHLFSGEKWSKPHVRSVVISRWMRCSIDLVGINLALQPPAFASPPDVRCWPLRYEHMIAELRGHGLMLDSDPRQGVAAGEPHHFRENLKLKGMWTTESCDNRTFGLFGRSWSHLDPKWSKQRLLWRSIGLCLLEMGHHPNFHPHVSHRMTSSTTRTPRLLSSPSPCILLL